ncbi:remorin [Tanacetum coccineum]
MTMMYPSKSLNFDCGFVGLKLSVSSMGISSVTFDSTQVDQSLVNPKDHAKDTRVKPHQFQKPDSSNSSSVHPLRSLEDENLDYDSNASSSSFEFHKGERSTHNPISRSLLRPMSSKWNDAEKWIINKQIIQHHNQKNSMQRSRAKSRYRITTGSIMSTPLYKLVQERFLHYTTSQPQQDTVSGQTTDGNESTNPCPESKDLLEIDTSESSCPEVRSVSMRDMGTEMTPIPSQEPSTTSTPIGATTPLRSPVSSMPSTPRRGGPTSTPIDQSNPKELTAQEVKLRTRKEILQLGVQLGKMNIAAWASKEDMEKNASDIEADNLAEEALRIEFEKRAIAWEDAEKTKHNARFIREEIKIQAWESQQKAKLEAEMRRIEVV